VEGPAGWTGIAGCGGMGTLEGAAVLLGLRAGGGLFATGLAVVRAPAGKGGGPTDKAEVDAWIQWGMLKCGS